MAEKIRKWVVDERKVRDYLLSRSHPIGRFKARFFFSLGYSEENWQDLQSRVLEIAAAGEMRADERNDFGQKYLISGTLVGSGGQSAEVETVWIVAPGSDTARLVTVYPR